MAQRIRYLNLSLLLLLFPLSALLIKSYIVYRHTPHGRTQVRFDRRPPSAEHHLDRYAPIIENTLFPSSSKRLIPIDTGERGGERRKVYGNQGTNSLILLGVVVGLDGYAVFSNKASGEEEFFRVGDVVFDAGILKEVVKGEAVLEVGAREVSFTIPEEDMKEYVPTESGQGLRNQLEGKSVTSSSPDRSLRYSRRVSANEWVIDRRAVMKALEDMSQVLTDARITPRMVKGKVEGFLVTEIKPRGIFNAIGLKNGDVLMRVNNYDIVSPERAMQVLSGLKGASKVDIDLIRGGERMSFHYQMR
ncbi:MAG: hypothetical protein ACE5GF_08515 [Thermodesulfobacteriota bacterium]